VASVSPRSHEAIFHQVDVRSGIRGSGSRGSVGEACGIG